MGSSENCLYQSMDIMLKATAAKNKVIKLIEDVLTELVKQIPNCVNDKSVPLYLPGETKEVDKIISNQFKFLEDTKEFSGSASTINL